jgi:transcriptional regulator with XRE-family HTH domain
MDAPSKRAEEYDRELRARAALILRDAMDVQGLSQGQLAVRLGISQSAISQMLNGRGNLTLQTLSYLAAELGYTVEIAATPS